jgi:cell division protein FtsZ
VLLNITGSDYTLFEVHEAAAIIQEAADPDANIIFGAVIDDSMEGEIQITVIATGFDGRPRETMVRPQATRSQPISHTEQLPSRHEMPQPQPQPRPAPSQPVAQPSVDPYDLPTFLRNRQGPQR